MDMSTNANRWDVQEGWGQKRPAESSGRFASPYRRAAFWWVCPTMTIGAMLIALFRP
jgi:hypothetical protein